MIAKHVAVKKLSNHYETLNTFKHQHVSVYVCMVGNSTAACYRMVGNKILGEHDLPNDNHRDYYIKEC